MEEKRRINPGLFACLNIPVWLLKRSEISSGAKFIYGLLAHLCGFGSEVINQDRRTLGNGVGLTVKQVDRCIKELKLCGLIGIIQRGLTMPNSYVFFYHGWMDMEPATLILYDELPLDLPKRELLTPQKGNSSQIPQRKRLSYPNADSANSLSLYSSVLKRDLEKEVSDIVGRINSLSGKHYKPTSKNIVKFLIARMEEGEDANLKNCLLVVEHRWLKWGEDERMFESFNPVTIFRKANFEKYLVEAQAARDGAGEWEPPEVRNARK